MTLFSGYDSQALAMERLKRDYCLNYELVAWCEIDKMAIHAHNALFPQMADRNVGDICNIDPETLLDCDVVTWSFPCQAISTAGRQAGLKEGSGTTSSLAWECMKIFRAKKPKFLLMENVKALTQKKFMSDFMRLQKELDGMGYTNFWQVLNAKDFGVPQNRERVFMVSILRDNAAFEFPKPFPLEKRLRDVLEDNVDESYYLKDEQVARILEHCERKQAEGCGFKHDFQDADGICGTITTAYGSRQTDTFLKTEPEIIQVGNYMDDTGRGFKNPQCGRVYSPEGLSPTLNTCGGGDREPKILTPIRTEEQRKLRKKGIDTFGGRQLVPRTDGVSNTITTVQKDNLLQEQVIDSMQANAMCESIIVQNAHGYNKGGLFKDISPTVTSSSFQENNFVVTRFRIRKLTPRECFRLMGVGDADIDKIDAYRIRTTLKDGTVKEKPISKSAKYKMAGNSIVVDVLYYIFWQMFVAEPPKPQPRQLTLFD